jgi:hypothetical protein
MSLPTNNKSNKQGKGQKSGSQGGSKFIQKPGTAKPAGGVAKKANRTGGTRGS